MIFFTSDTHFYHTNVIKHSSRPFKDIENMNRALIENWNSTVTDNDEIFILGDVTLKGTSYANKILSRLNGQKYLVKGNHDRFAEQQSFDKSSLIWIKDYYELRCKDMLFILFHYPIKDWNHRHHGAIHLHGHQHNTADYNQQNMQSQIRRFDVGVDANDLRPVSIEKILSAFAPADIKS